MADDIHFPGIEELLEDIGAGIGKANKELVGISATDVGTLAVKTADVNVSFELTSQTKSSGVVAGVGNRYGAKTLSVGLQSLTDASANKCAIQMHIVSVATPIPPKDGEDAPDGNTGEAPKDGSEDPPVPDTTIPSKFEIHLAWLKDKVTSSKVKEPRKQQLLSRIVEIESMIAGGKPTEADKAFATFLLENADILSDL